ncbi:hypothetical protein S40285_07777 [Stachybotrys chlorohalonatus IBT 40285]|uniref:Uncharacterized protein n=1 Tax=Stachybotrys chlorohalonatus (strain IBT 40285) TaxID=1283841 RepID=A0A084QIN2_STAC4|nr:hypothetical protein S40285_07777 [Stachybotrys chlorohalonata IBT 40285]
MSPIRVGLIGLGAVSSSDYRPGEWGVQHMKAIASSPNFELVAICNSSVESAQRSISSHNLSSNVKAYGSPEDIARDTDVDLVAVAVNITKHFELAKPAILHKKDVYIEFPATPSIVEAEELVALAKEHGVKVIVGSQARSEPMVRKLKELVEDKAIGDIISSSLIGHVPIDVSNGWLESVAGFLDINSPISRVVITLSHPLDAFVHVLGYFTSVQSTFKVSSKTTPLFDAKGQIADPSYKITAPDTMLLQGVLNSGAAVSFFLRASSASADGNSFHWIISGTKGEIIFTAGQGFIQTSPLNGKIVMRKKGEEAEEVDFTRQEGDHVAKSESTPRNILRVYEAYAGGDTDGYENIEQALQTQRLVEEVKKNAIWAP